MPIVFIHVKTHGHLFLITSNWNSKKKEKYEKDVSIYFKFHIKVHENNSVTYSKF